MKKAVLIPDSFKGTLSSIKICEIIKERINARFPSCKVISVPVADGGEGSVDCFLSALGGERIWCEVNNPYSEKMSASYGILADGKTAVIEMAACCGLPLVEDRKDPMKTTTFGLGELILDAANKGCQKIIVGLGGSCTNDAGCGAAAAIGIKFYDKAGKEFVPVGGNLEEVVHIDVSTKNKALDNVEIVTMCDIDNPLYGKNGAAYIFAPQKGADERTVEILDNGLVSISKVIEKSLDIDVKNIPGGGAAGGCGSGMVAFFNSNLQMGIETVLNTVGFDNMIEDADVVFTGEGKMDSQSLRGKVVIGVARRAKKQSVPVIVVAGGYDEDLDKAYDEGITAIFSINRLPQDLEVSRYHSEENLSLTVDNILRTVLFAKSL
ncbi:MAG: glycerate kinase [Firmicutes bacterium]|jgi:glycerate kinase|nr:glycerate kinase [Bacillota bacterium]